MFAGLEIEETKESGPAPAPVSAPIRRRSISDRSLPVRRRSILKTTDDDDDEAGGPEGVSSRRRRSTTDLDDDGCGVDGKRIGPPRRRVSFTSVDIQEHDLTLGDHPGCSFGPPTTLDWKVKRRHSLDIEEFEEEREQTRRPHRKLVINYYERKERLKDAGHTDGEMKQATKDAGREKTRRSITKMYAHTPIFQVEHALASATRKFKRATGMAPKKKKNGKKLEDELSRSGRGVPSAERGAGGKDGHEGSPCPPIANITDLQPNHFTTASA